MNTTIVKVSEIKLIGLDLGGTTSNENGQSNIDGGNLCQKFENENYADQIPNKSGNEIYAVYYGYEGDHSEPFRYFIGCRVKDHSEVPEDMDRLTIPAGSFQKITAKGKMPDCVANAWRDIWNSDISRSYNYDFEVFMTSGVTIGAMRRLIFIWRENMMDLLLNYYKPKREAVVKTDKLNVEVKGRELILTRTFDAPPALMFKVWTDCKHLKHWWGPKEWPMDECKMDFWEGGEWHYCLRGPNEEDESWGKAVYQEIDESNKIVYNDYFSDANGNINEEMPGMLITVEFIEKNGNTQVVNSTLFDSPETRKEIEDMGVVQGMNSSLDRLEEYLAELQ